MLAQLVGETSVLGGDPAHELAEGGPLEAVGEVAAEGGRSKGRTAAAAPLPVPLSFLCIDRFGWS